MAKIRIESNPYEQRIKYFRWSEDHNDWVSINEDEDSKSKLLSEKLSKKFFPFIVKEIVDVICDEFENTESAVEIIFNGTSDEYRELEAICSKEEYAGRVELSKTEEYLENARDILPEIVEIFQKLQPLVLKSIKDDAVQKEMRKFSEATKDEIPVCVMGNYSSGKSMFINALIGREILPTSDSPMTAKIYKVTDSNDSDDISISFYSDGEKIGVEIHGTDVAVSCQNMENPAVSELMDELHDLEVMTQDNLIASALAYANECSNDDTDYIDVFDIIEVVVPFVGGPLAESSYKFVIIDTPGPNSASNFRHKEILESAMKDLSNGIPVFISEYKDLDANDNAVLYNLIKDMDQLDDRFTMVIVNKADKAHIKGNYLSEKEKNKLMNWYIPRTLYSEGIYFVSSLMGLGAKLNGAFSDDIYQDSYLTMLPSFSDVCARIYKQMYRYNIMPEQIKERMIADAECFDQSVLVNSGLYCIEQEMRTFAGKYSAYNKCHQAQKFLERIIVSTNASIEDLSNKISLEVQTAEDKLKNDKENLIDKLCAERSDTENSYLYDYSVAMTASREQATKTIGWNDLTSMEKELQPLFETETDSSQYVEQRNAAWNTIGENLKGNMSVAFSKFNRDSVRNIGKSLYSDISDAVKKTKEKSDNDHDVTRLVADKLVEDVKNLCIETVGNGKYEIERSSQTFWSIRSGEFKRILAGIVNGTNELSDEFRGGLANLILGYSDLNLVEATLRAFDEEDFNLSFNLGSWKLWKSDHLDKLRLADTYNKQTIESLGIVTDRIRSSHENSFVVWLDDLMKIVIDNIIEYNPDLLVQSEQIDAMKAEIEDLEERKALISEYKNRIDQMLTWK